MTKTTWDKLDELADWHATFPGKDAQTVCKLWGECQQRAARAEASLFEATASQQMCVGAAGIEDFSELCGWIDDVKQKLAAEKAARLKAESACGEMRRLLELLKIGPVFRDEVDHALGLLDAKKQ